ncbi:MAG: acetylglutamate kinase [Muribaculum sp.]|nr:acetylglutamate kinase [Muribaculaceae bacterium]MCM1080373.1 acetylglutamate kinase [Muribaculum sp.]
MMEKLTIIKVGGKIVEQHESLLNLLASFKQIEGKKILVHGGGRSATALATQMGVETTMIDGRRVTDTQMLRIVTMVYAGEVNKTIVASLQALGINSIGLTGADADIILSHRRKPTAQADFGWVGDVDRVNPKPLHLLLGAGIVPVIAPLTHDGQGHMLNTNADTMAQAVATGMASLYNVDLIYTFEKPGVMKANSDSLDDVIPLITPQSFSNLRADGTISGGMIPKIENALEALRQGVRQVKITLADNIHNPSAGTRIKLQEQ